ncbi:long-chain fatty acid transporter [Flavipsychrobacter stenotrophus]|uniref:Long-chain fatty acid transporter n=1 Tax=Flavipsychrobacter stenotrophus TaxID=2077091 RepID=A0A2S7SRB9_9BACT|nr:outer membrane protein transport protein [Flavipsychrobacter stenotrophus]PQJ09157.1 long-chain fatty acid transporter [Flavipsychrobacter stenotrophus]
MKKLCISAIACFLYSSGAFGAGFQLNLQGLRQLAMANTGTAWAWDASSIFYNPGAVSRLEGMQVYGAVNFVMPSVKYVQTPTGGYSAETKAQTFTPFNLYFGGTLKKHNKIGVGIGVYTPFGSGTKWDDNWQGRYINRNISLQSFFVQPTVSYKINELVSVGAGFIYAFGNVKIEQALPVQFATGADSKGTLEGNANGVGFNLGVHVKATEKIQLGLTYRSQVKMKVDDGNATFVVPSSLTANFPNTNFSTKLNLPDVITFGVGYKVNTKLIILADLEYTGWKVYDSLVFDYKTNTSSLADTRTPRLYQSVMAIRLGANYQIMKSLSVSAGAAYDPTPVRDGYVSPELPDANRYVGTVGASFSPMKKITIMAALEFVTSDKRDATFLPANFSGKYQSTAFTGGVGFAYHF